MKQPVLFPVAAITSSDFITDVLDIDEDVVDEVETPPRP
jgi:hypothetical protein